MVQNALLKYSIEKLLNVANPRGEYFFKKTHLNKMIYLLFLRLKEREIDIHLPYYWYRYGSLVDERSFEIMVGNPLSHYYTHDGSTRAMSRVPQIDIDVSIRAAIDEEIHALVRKYQNGKGLFFKGYLQQILDDAYATAPYEFQRTFNRGLLKYAERFRTPVRKKIPVSLHLQENEIASIREYLVILMNDFNDDFSEIFDLFLEWEDTMQLSLKYDHKIALKILNEYWEFFVNLLRINKHENIPRSEVDEWIRKFHEHDLIIFKKNLKKTRNYLLLQDLGNSSVSEEIDHSVDQIMDYAFQLSMNNRLSR
ncbi:MAG: hypothetical protein WC382_02505 [Methanoregulaceae archaeon]